MIGVRVLLLLSALLTPAVAGAVVLTFEGVGDLASVNNFYNGGTDSAGNAGPNFGIRFSSASLGIIDSDAGGSGNIANEPSPSTVLFFTSGTAATMNVPAGFTTGFSFFYAASRAGFVNVYSGLDATGVLLASLPLTVNSTTGCTGDPNGGVCNFDPIGVAFAGTAMSADFGGSANFIGFDDVTVGSAVPGVAPPAGVSEPGALALFGAALVAFRLSRRRKKN